MNEIELIIKVQSEMKKEVTDIRKELDKLKEDAKKTTTSMEKGFKKVAGAAKVMITAFVFSAGKEMVKSAEKQTLALKILELKSKDVHDQLLNTSEATFGLANKFDMVTAANKAMAFGIDLSGGRLTKLMKISSKLAVVMGIDTKQAFDDLITSSARQQKLIADNLGVMIDKVRVDTAYAKILGKTKDELTEMEQSQAFLNEVLKKGAVITGDLTDEFVKMNTKGTKAIKTIETLLTSFINTVAELFIDIGDGIGFIWAKVTDSVKTELEIQERVLHAFNKGRVESERVTLKELKQLQGIAAATDKEQRKATVMLYRAYYKELSVIQKEASDFAIKSQKRDLSVSVTDAIQFEKANKNKLIALAKKFNVNLKKGRAIDFVDFELIMNEKTLKFQQSYDKMEKIVKNTPLFKLVNAGFKQIDEAQKQIEVTRKISEKKDKDWWKKNKTRVLSERKSLAKEIIGFEKKIIDFSDLSNFEQIKAKERFEKKILDLTKNSNAKKLKVIRASKALELDIKKGAGSELDVMSGLASLWEDTKGFLETEGDKFKTKQEVKAAQEKTRRVQADKEIFDDLFSQRVAFNKKIADEETKSAKKQEALSQKHFSMLQSFGSQHLDAIISGNANKIPEILAQQSMMFGQQIFWDGLKTWWFGTSENSIFPGLGSSAVAVGAAEMVIGAGMMGAGAAGANAISSSDDKDSGASERNNARGGQDMNLNVITSMYGSPTEAKRVIKGMVA